MAFTQDDDHQCDNLPTIDTLISRTFRHKIFWPGGIAFLVSGLLFTACGVWMIVRGEQAGWLVAGFFGLIPCICVLRLLPSCAYIRISQHGIEYRSSFRSVLFPWSDIESFSFNTSGNPTNDFVEVVLTESAADAGARIPLPPLCGIMPAILLTLLTDWKRTLS
jgi:hypothetical protein